MCLIRYVHSWFDGAKLLLFTHIHKYIQPAQSKYVNCKKRNSHIFSDFKNQKSELKVSLCEGAYLLYLRLKSISVYCHIL